MKSLESTFLKKINNKDDYFSFIHMADSHSGYKGNASKYNEYAALRIDKTNEQGINIRQADIDKAFSEVINLAVNLNVDAVLHAGDGWDAVGYPDRTVDNAYTKEVSKLFEKNISYVEIVGNHNLPKKVGKGCFLESLGRYPNVHTAYKGFYEPVELLNGEVIIHCIPSTFNQGILDESIEKAKKNHSESAINIGLGHFGVTSIKHYADNAEKTLLTTLDNLIDCNFDYFALGDYHKPTTFNNSIRFSGSIERLGFGEVDNKPQVFVVCINKKTKEVEVQPYPLSVRPMLDLPPIDAENKKIEDINSEIENTILLHNLEDAIVRLRLYKLPTHLKPYIDVEKIEELTSNALFFKLELREKKEESLNIKTSDEVDFEGIIEGWNAYMNKIEDDGSFDKEVVWNLGLEKLSNVLER